MTSLVPFEDETFALSHKIAYSCSSVLNFTSYDFEIFYLCHVFDGWIIHNMLYLKGSKETHVLFKAGKPERKHAHI